MPDDNREPFGVADVIFPPDEEIVAMIRRRNQEVIINGERPNGRSGLGVRMTLDVRREDGTTYRVWPKPDEDEDHIIRGRE